MKKIYVCLVMLILFASTGTFAQTTYFSKAAATDFNDVNSWGTVADGSGAAPASISNADYFTIANSSSMTLSGNAAVGKLTIGTGSLTVSGNTLAVALATGNNSTFSMTTGSTFTISGGSLIVNGNVAIASGANLNQSGGVISVDGNNAGAAATSVATGTPIFAIGSVATSYSTGTVSLTGGTIVIVDPHVGSGTSDYAFVANLAANSNNITATGSHTLQIGDGVSTDAGGSATNGYFVYFWLGTGAFKTANMVINAPSGTNRHVLQSYKSIVGGNLTITAGELRYTGSGPYNVAGNITVAAAGIFTNSLTLALSNGTYTSSTAITNAAATTAQTISGAGIFRNAITSPTANFASILLNNTSAGGVTFPNTTNIAAQPANSASISGTLTFTAGKAFSAPGASVVLGIATPAVGTLTYTAGGFGSGTKFGRWFTAATTGTAFTASTDPTSATSRYPFVAANLDGRSAWLNRVTPTAGGVLYVAYTEAAGTTPVSITDGAYTVTAISNDSWAVSGTAAATSYGIAIVAPNVYGATPPDATSRVVRAADVVGTYLAGTVTPAGQRTGINPTDIASTFYIGMNLSTCSGTPNAGSSATSTYNLCTGATQVLTVTGVSTGLGISYQWESSADGVTGWGNVTGGSGATTTSYTTPAFAGTIYYRLKTICSASALSNTSNVITVTTPVLPATQVTAFTASNLTSTGATLNWVIGSGNNRSVYINTTNSFVDPVTPNTPGTAATAFTNTGQQLVYDGSGTSVSVTGLTAGTTYYVRIYESQKCASPASWYYNTTTATGNPGTFSINSAPANDECATAISVATQPYVAPGTCPGAVSGTTLGATGSSITAPPSSAWITSQDDDVWYQFTATGAAQVFRFCNVTYPYGAPQAIGMSIHSNCSASATELYGNTIAITGGTGEVAITGFTVGTTYKLRILTSLTTSRANFDFSILDAPNMTLVSSTTTQAVTTSVAGGSVNNQVIGLEAVVSGASNPLSVTTINFNTLTTVPSDVINAKVYYTGNSSTFATTTLYGTAVVNPNGTFSVTGSQLLAGTVTGNATNYFWLTYDLACGAAAGNTIDASCTDFTANAVNYIPTVTSPAGTRAITALVNPAPSTVQPLTTSVPSGSFNVQVLQVSIAASPCLNSITQLNFTNASSNVADIAKAKVYFTTTSTFATTTQFGSDVLLPGASFNVSGTSPVLPTTGTLYFWLVYDIDCAAPATAGNVADASFTGIVTNLGTLTATTANPSGTRTITAAVAGDNISSAPAVVLGAAGGNPFNISGKSLEAGEPSPLINTQPSSTNGSGSSNYSWGSVAGGTQWFKLTVPTTGYGSSGNLLIRATTTASPADAQLALWKFPNIVAGGGCGTAPNFTGGVLLAANDDAIVNGTGYTGSSTLNSVIRVRLTPGSTYYIQLDGYTTSTPSGDLIVEDLADPAGKNVSNNGFGDIHNPAASEMLSASYEVIGDDGWTYYYNNNGTSTNIADDKVILGLNWSSSATYLWNGSNGTATNDMMNHIRRDATSGTAPSATGVSSSTGTDAFVVWSGRLAALAASGDLKPTAPYVQAGASHWWMLNKFWNVFPNVQPTTTVGVRYFYSDADYAALNSAITSGGGTALTAHSDMEFLKFTKSATTHYTNAEVNPASGHSAILKPTVSKLPWTNTDAVQTGINQAQFSISTFSGGGGGSTGQAALVLPIGIEYFRGSKQQAGNILDWKVSSTSTATLTLERSTDRVNYKGINAQAATPDRMLTPFTYTDAAPAAGINYYRLKITNADGESKYSNVVALINKEKGFELISVAPNPVQHSTVLSLSSVKAGKVELSVSDVTGKVVMKQSVGVIAGNNPITLNFAALAAGTYQITAVNADGDSKSTRFVKF
jgi:hypothetical protein